MSCVTNIILTWPLNDDENPQGTLDALHAAYGSTGQLKLVKVCCQGGSKYLEHNIAIGAMNYANVPNLVTAIKGTNFDQPEDVRLFVCAQFDDHFSPVPL